MDGVDVGAFADCDSRPAVSISAGCENADFDNDNDVDQEDFGIFQVCISGESISGDPYCAAPVRAPDMVLIPSGEFQMGNSFSSSEGGPNELPRHTVYVSAFHMDRTEVTNYHYCDALNWASGQGLIYVSNGYVFGTGNGRVYCSTTTSSSYGGIQYTKGAFAITSGRRNHPAVHVSWYGAAAYANWRSQRGGREPCYTLSGAWTCDFSKNGYRLPTEAEWEKAARGGADGHRFPWSDQETIQHARANYDSQSNYSYDTSATLGDHPLWAGGLQPRTSPVGFFNGTLRQKADFNWPSDATSYQTSNGANGYGLYDVAGNALEWCNDWYGASYYSGSPSNNPRGPTSGSIRILRGGSRGNDARGCRVACRNVNYPDALSTAYGFRIALSAP